MHSNMRRMNCAASVIGGSSRFQARHLCFELEAQLCGFVVGQPVGHLRENGAVEPGLLRIPGIICTARASARILWSSCRTLLGSARNTGVGLSSSNRSACSSSRNRSRWREDIISRTVQKPNHPNHARNRRAMHPLA
jgi:hypothetical protein